MNADDTRHRSHLTYSLNVQQTSPKYRATTAQRMLRAASLALGAMFLLHAFSDGACAGVIFSAEASARAGLQAGDRSTTDGLPTRDGSDRRVPPSLAHLLHSGSGATGAGTSSGSSVSSSTSTSALCWAACAPPLPELISALQGEGPLFFKSPPVVELLKPPKT